MPDCEAAPPRLSLRKLFAVVAIWSFAFAALHWSGARLIGGPWWAVTLFTGIVTLPVGFPLTLVVLSRRRVWPWLISGAFAVLASAFMYARVYMGHRTWPTHELLFLALYTAGYDTSAGGCFGLALRAAERHAWPMVIFWQCLALGFIALLAFLWHVIRFGAW